MTKVQIIAANHAILRTDEGVFLQSYNSVICAKIGAQTFLDSKYWDYSATTGKHRNAFLNETKKETEKKIASGEYILTNLN